MDDNNDPDDVGDICQVCGGPLYPLGTLGQLTWKRCRNCGMEYSTPADTDADDDGGEVADD